MPSSIHTILSIRDNTRVFENVSLGFDTDLTNPRLDRGANRAALALLVDALVFLNTAFNTSFLSSSIDPDTSSKKRRVRAVRAPTSERATAVNSPDTVALEPFATPLRLPLSCLLCPACSQTRYREDRRSGSPRLGSYPSVLRDHLLSWLRDSAWPRLIMVGFHVAEVCERTIPLASLTAALGDWALFAPLALTPGMFARYVARRARTSRSRGDSGGVAASVRSALKSSLVRTHKRSFQARAHRNNTHLRTNTCLRSTKYVR